MGTTKTELHGLLMELIENKGFTFDQASALIKDLPENIIDAVKLISMVPMNTGSEMRLLLEEEDIQSVDNSKSGMEWWCNYLKNKQEFTDSMIKMLNAMVGNGMDKTQMKEMLKELTPEQLLILSKLINNDLDLFREIKQPTNGNEAHDSIRKISNLCKMVNEAVQTLKPNIFCRVWTMFTGKSKELEKLLDGGKKVTNEVCITVQDIEKEIGKGNCDEKRYNEMIGKLNETRISAINQLERLAEGQTLVNNKTGDYILSKCIKNVQDPCDKMISAINILLKQELVANKQHGLDNNNKQDQIQSPKPAPK